MNKRPILVLLAAALVGGTMLRGTGSAQPPDAGATKPVAEQNLDTDGLIRVHEQGVASVDVTNSNLDVNVVGGAVGVTPVTDFRQLVLHAVAGETDTQSFPSIAVSSIVNISEGQFQLSATTPINVGSIHLWLDVEGGVKTQQLTFPQPVPIDGLELFCRDQSPDDCTVFVLLTGF